MKCTILCDITLISSLLSIFSAVIGPMEAKTFMRCELAKKLLLTYSFNGSLLPSWICLIEHESNSTTSIVTPKPNGSSNYGLFQINSKEWCGQGRKSGICKKKCEDFIDDNIDDDVECAKQVFDRDGFKHWQGWNKYCRNLVNLPNLKTLCKT